VRRYVPELRGVPAAQCPQPGAREGLLSPSGYVALMIDVATERNEALARFHEARQGAALDGVAT
jgi:deoxyribodipyrimidine photolyase